jgi:hypothetical protein
MTRHVSQLGLQLGENHTSMVVSIDPRLRVRLYPLDRTYVVGFAVIIPGINLHKVYYAPVGDEALPAFREEPIVTSVNEVFTGVVLRVD